MAAAVICVVNAHLTRPLATTGRRMLVLGAAGAAAGRKHDASAARPPRSSIGVAAGAAVRLALGTSAGLPTVADVAAALEDLGVAAHANSRRPSARSPACFVVHGREPDGSSLTIKVYGRDAYDNQMLEKLWRTLWYRDGGPAVSGLNRAKGAEREALLTLLAAQRRRADRRGRDGGSDGARRLAGRPARRRAGRSSRSPPAKIDDALLGRSWAAVRASSAAPTSPTATSARPRCTSTGRSVSLVDLGGGTVAPDIDDRLTDRAQLLATTAAVAGTERAVAAALAAVGREELDGAAAVPPARRLRAAPAAGAQGRRDRRRRRCASRRRAPPASRCPSWPSCGA